MRGQTRTDGLWDIYQFAYSVALRSLSWRRARDAARLLIEPCTYWRCVEVPAVMRHLRAQPGERILDIGSPKLLSLFLCYHCASNVYATDLYPYFFEEYSHYVEKLRLAPSGAAYCIQVQDARSLSYPDSSFDKVYSISVLEHIEHGGDTQAMREIARVLKPGGVCCLTVPFAERYRESTIDRELYYKKPVNGAPVFYERHYDLESLRTRLIVPSGLHIRTMEFFEERWFPYERFYLALPKAVRILFSGLSPLFSGVFLHQLPGDSSRLSGAEAVLLLMVRD